jgi:hypothetical protein
MDALSPVTDTNILKYKHMNTIHKSIILSKTARVVELELVTKKSLKGIAKDRPKMYCNFVDHMTRV